MKRSSASSNKHKENKEARHFWVPDAQEVWLPGMLMEDKGLRLRVLIGGERTVDVEKAKCREISDRSVIFETTDDLISLGEVNDSAILNSTRLRFSQKIIYTSIGSVLMAVNPFAKIEGLYSPLKIVEYENPREGEKSAHVYLIPSRAYDSMKTFGKNQSILISGESGAGKTEATKQCLAFITKVAGASGSSKPDDQSGSSGRRASLLERRASVARRKSFLEQTMDHGNVDMTVTKEKAKADIAQRVIAASPILEAFGNAQTIRNPNSSRFGKWMELSFDDKNQITGSKITSYLLEKSRVTGRDALERNYHVFYQVIRGGNPALLDALALKRESTAYNYLSNGDGVEAKNFKDEENYTEMMEAFDLMGFPLEESEGLLRIVAAVLHLGNITFDSLEEGEASQVNSSAGTQHALTHAARLLGVQAATDLGKVLCIRTITTGPRKSITEVRLTPQKALDTRDSLAKTLFDRVFKEIIVRINKYSKSGPSTKCIGLLDIFGFEIFKNNSFEQLCINYCNEMLQNHFNLVIFINEKNMYAAENITCDTIEFKDNHLVISSIEGCFKSLDEEAKIPKGSSKTWYDKMKRSKAPSGPSLAGAELMVLSFPTTAVDTFIVSHYAGPVSYLPENFMEKNIDTLNSDILQLMTDSNVADVKILFEEPEPVSSPAAPASKRFSTVGGKAAVRSIAWHFQSQLASLMQMLGATESHFIRCVKSNDACKPLVFDSELVHRQLVYSGVFEVVKIQQSGLPFRFIHDEFYERYSAILPLRVRWTCIGAPDKALDVIRSLPQCQNRLSHMQIGRTMTFMNSKEYRLLESLKDEIESDGATSIQCWVKTQCLRRHFSLYRRLKKEATDHLAARRIEAAETAIEALKLNSARATPLYACDASYYHPLIVELDRLKVRAEKQLEIVTELSKITEKPEDTLSLVDLETAKRLVRDAREMEDFEDSSIDECEEIVVCFSMADKAAKSVVSVKSLSAADIAQTVAALTRFKHVLPAEATAVISQANTYIESIQSEMEQFVPRISTALLQNSLSRNSQSGDLDGDTSTQSLEAALEGIDEGALVSFECKRMVSLCHLCIKLRRILASGDDVGLVEAIKKEQEIGGLLAIESRASPTPVRDGSPAATSKGAHSRASMRRLSQHKHDSLAQLKRSSSISEVAMATEETIVFVQKQSVMLFAWATERSLFNQLKAAVAECAAADALPSLKQCVQDVEAFIKGDDLLFSDSADPAAGVGCSKKFLDFVSLAKEILRLRTAYQSNEWINIESILKSFGLSPEVFDLRSDVFFDSVADYREAVTTALAANTGLFSDSSAVELVSADVYFSIWRVKHYRVLQALKSICQRTPFSEANIESGNYSSVSQGSNEDNEIVQIAQSFVENRCHISSIGANLSKTNKTAALKEDVEFTTVLSLACNLIALRYLVTAIATGSTITASNAVFKNAGISISEETQKSEGGVLRHGLELLKTLGSHAGLRCIQFPLFDRELSAAKLILHIVESEAELERCLFELSVQPIPMDTLKDSHSIQVTIDQSAVRHLEAVIVKMNALPKCPLSLAGNVDYAVNLLEVRTKVEQLINIGNHRVEGTQTLEDCVDYWNEACDLVDSLCYQLESLCVAEKYSELTKSKRVNSAYSHAASAGGMVKGGGAELAVINEEFCRQRFNSGLHLILHTHTVIGSVGAVHAQGDRSMEFFRAMCSEMDDADSTFYAPIVPLKPPEGKSKKKTTAAIFGLESPSATDGAGSMSAPAYLGYNMPLRHLVELIINIRQSIVKDDWEIPGKFIHHLMQIDGLVSVSKRASMFQKKGKSDNKEVEEQDVLLDQEETKLIEDIKTVPLMFIESVASELSLIHREGNHRKSIMRLANALENLQVEIDPGTERLVANHQSMSVEKLDTALSFSARQGQHNEDAKTLYKHAIFVKATLLLVREGQVQEIVIADLDHIVTYLKKRRVIRGVTLTMRHLTILLRFIRLHQIILKLYQASLSCCNSSPIPEPELVVDPQSATTASSVPGKVRPKQGRCTINSRGISVAVLRAKAENSVSDSDAQMMSRASVAALEAAGRTGPSHKSSLVAMGFQGDPDLDIWILAADTLRRLRTALSAENWKEALHVAKTLRGIATGGELEVVDAKQKAFRDVLLDQATKGYRCAIIHYLNIRMSLIKDLGPVGSRGGTGYCIPMQSVDVLKNFLAEIDTFEQIPEVVTVKNQVSHLYAFRKTIFEESRVTDAPESRKTSVLSEESSLADSFVAVEKSKNPFLPYVDPEPIKAIRSKPTSSSAAQRKLSLNDAKSKTAALLANDELGQDLLRMTGGEYSFVVSTSNLSNMLARLEIYAMMHVVSWTSEGTCSFHTDTLDRQTRAVQELSTAHPSVVDDIPLIKVLNELSNLVLVAQREKYDPVELDAALQMFSTLIQVVDLSSKLKAEMLVQIELLQRFHLLSQFNSIHEEAAQLFENKFFERKYFDEFLTKLDPLIRAAGGEECIPSDKLAVILCVRTARELCWVTELHMLTGRPSLVAAFEDHLEQNLDFKIRVGNWVQFLLSPKRVVAAPSSLEKTDTDANILNDSPVDEHALAVAAAEQKQAEIRELKEKKRKRAKENEVPPLEVYHVDKVVSSVIAFRATDDPVFDSKLEAMLKWQRRANLLNASWRAIFSMTEEWAVQNMHALLINHSPGVQVDGFAIQDMVRRIRSHIKEEVHPSLGRLISCLADTLCETERWCVVVKNAVVHDGSGPGPDVGTVVSSLELVKCMDICIFYFEQLNQLLNVLRSIIFQSRQGVLVEDKLWFMGCEVQSVDRICYMLEDVDAVCKIRAEGMIDVMSALAKVENGLSMLCEAVAGHSVASKKSTSSASGRTDDSCTVKEGGTEYELTMTLLEERTVKLTTVDSTVGSMDEETEPVQLLIRMYTCKYMGTIDHKNNNTIRVHVSFAKEDEHNEEQPVAHDLVISFKAYDPNLNGARRKKILETAFTYIYSRFSMLEEMSLAGSPELAVNSRALSIPLLKAGDREAAPKRVRLDNAAYDMMSTREEIDRFRQTLQGCYLDHRAAGEVQEILNNRNAGNANISLKDLLHAATENVTRLITLLRERCYLMCTSRIGYRLSEFSPWTVQWLNCAEMKEAAALSVRFPQQTTGFSGLLMQTMMKHSELVYAGTNVLERAAMASIDDFRDLLPELNEVTKLIKQTNVSAIVDDAYENDCSLHISPWWTEEEARAWLSSQQLALNVIVRSVESIELFRDMELLVIRFKDSFLYDAISTGSKKFMLNRRSIRQSVIRNQNRKSISATSSSKTVCASPPGNKLPQGKDLSPGKTGPVGEVKAENPMQTVAVALQAFVDTLLSQTTTCDDESIPKKCFDLLFYAKLFLPTGQDAARDEMVWYRNLALRASTFMSTRLLFRTGEDGEAPRGSSRRESSINNSTVDELQIMSNLETYRRAMLLSMHLQQELVNRSVKQCGILSSLGGGMHSLSPTEFIHTIIYVMPSDELPSYMQPHYALSTNAKPFSKNEETDAIIESLHDMVEAVTSFQTLRKTGIEKYYNIAPRGDASPAVMQLNADFEIALKVTVLRQPNIFMRTYLYREVLVSLDNGLLYIPRKSFEGIICASKRNSCYLPGLFDNLCQVLSALRQSIFHNDLDTTDSAGLFTEDDIAGGRTGSTQLQSYLREMNFLSGELDALLATETDSNEFCQLACLRATRNLCRLIHQIIYRPSNENAVMSEDALKNVKTSWRHCSDEILNDLALGQCLTGEEKTSEGGNSSGSSHEYLMRRLLSDVQAVGWIAGRISRLVECVNDDSFAVFTLCMDCFEVDTANDRGAEAGRVPDDTGDVTDAWRWYTLIPASDEPVDSVQTGAPIPKSRLSIELATIKECYADYRDICFKYTGLIFKDHEGSCEAMDTDTFIKEACRQLDTLHNFCRKWAVAVPPATAEGSIDSAADFNVYELHANKYKAATVAAQERQKVSSRAAVGGMNLDAGIAIGRDETDVSPTFSPETAANIIFDPEQFLLSWAVDSVVMGQSLYRIRDKLQGAISSRFCEDLTARLQAALNTWSSSDYVDDDFEKLTARKEKIEPGVVALLDILKYTAAVIPRESAGPEDSEADEEKTEPVTRRASTKESIYAHLTAHPMYVVPYYLTPETHKKCLESGDIPLLTMKALIVLGVREAAAIGRWFSEKPVLDQANLGKFGDNGSEGSEMSELKAVSDEDTVEYWIYQWFALRWSPEFNFGGDLANVSNAVIGDAEINFVVTLLENVCLSRQVLQLKDFLYSLHSGELNSLFSNCSFHVSDPWGSSAVSAGDEEDMQLVEKAKSRLKKDFLHNDENRYMMFEYVKFVLSRAFVSRPYEILSHETASSLGCVEVLYDMLISSGIQAVWALPSLDQRPMSIPSTDVPSIVKAESTDLFEAQSFEKQVEVALKSAKHELSVHLSVDMVLKNVHFRHVHEMYQFSEAGLPSQDINDPRYQRELGIHISEFNTVEDFVHATIDTMVREDAREDMQIKAALIGQYLDFWKSRFNCQQDVCHVDTAEIQRLQRSGTTAAGLSTLLGADAAEERLRTTPLSMIKDWIEVSASSFDELFYSNQAEMSFLRTDVAIERRRSIINSLALVYQSAVRSYDASGSDVVGFYGPRIKKTYQKGRNFDTDRRNPIAVELASWLSKVNEETSNELFAHLREFPVSALTVQRVLEEVKEGALDKDGTATATAATVDGGRGDVCVSAEFAYDNVLSVAELSPTLREFQVVEKVLSWLCDVSPDDMDMVVDMVCAAEENEDSDEEKEEGPRDGVAPKTAAPANEIEAWEHMRRAGGNEFDNMLVDKVNAVLQCPVMPMPLFKGLLNWKDALVTQVFETRLKEEIQSSIAVSVSAAACNGRKHMFLILAEEFLKLSMLLVEKDFLLGQRQLRRATGPAENLSGVDPADRTLPSPVLLRASVFILSVLMAVLEEDWDRVDALAVESGGRLLQISPDGEIETERKAANAPAKRRPSVSVFQTPLPPPKDRKPSEVVPGQESELDLDVASINNAVAKLFETARRIKNHNHILEMIEEQISYDLSRSFHTSGAAPSDSISRAPSLDKLDEPGSATGTALHGYFQFIDFVQLQEALAMYEQKQHVNSDELRAFIQLSEFLIRLRLAIIANKWFEDNHNDFTGDLPDEFVEESADEDEDEDEDQFDADDITKNYLGHVEASEGEAVVNDLLRRPLPARLVQQSFQRATSSPSFPSVSYLLLNEKPDFLPRHIAAEVQRVDKEFQNHQVEMRLIQALLSDQEYLQTGDYHSITTKHLEKVLLMSSIVRQRSIRTSQLYESAQKILNLRHSIKSADWSGIRCWLIELRDLAPEAEKEVSAVCEMSESNLAMHASLTQAMSQHRIVGSYAKLDISQTNIVLLLSALRAAETVPKLSADDRQVIYSAEKLKTVRLCILMADYTKLLREIEDIELRELADVAQDELFLVKRAIGFYTTLKNISNCLKTGHIVAAAGYAESQDVSLYVLNNSISSIDLNDCAGPIELYLQNATLIRDLRAAIKAGKWGSLELADLLLRSVRRNREAYEVRRKFSNYYSRQGDHSVMYGSNVSSGGKSRSSPSLTPFQGGQNGSYGSKLRSDSAFSNDDSDEEEDAFDEMEDDFEDDAEMRDEKAFHVATSLMQHCAHSLLNVDYGKIIFGRDEGDAASSGGMGSGSDRPSYLSPATPGQVNYVGGIFSARSNGSTDNMFRRQFGTTSNIEAVSGRRGGRSPPKKSGAGSPGKDSLNIYRRSSGVAPSFYKSSPKPGSQSFGGIEFEPSMGSLSGNLFPQSGRTLGNDIANEESGYTDVPQETLYLTNALNDPSLDATCVAALLGHDMPTTVLVEVEAEITQIRDELYHRVSSCILQKCFYTQQQLNNIAKGGLVASSASIPSLSAGRSKLASSRDILDGEGEKSPKAGDSAPGIASSAYVIDIDDAIHVARHLGVKSDSCRRLYLTALLIRDLRRSLKEVGQTGNRKKSLEVFVRAQSLKTNDMFDSMAAAELEQAFLSVCGGSMKADVMNSLLAMVSAPTSVMSPLGGPSPGPASRKVFKGATPEVVGKLKNAVRNARHVTLLASDPDIKTLITASEAMLALHAAVKVGVLSKMQVCYDIAVQVTSTAQLEDDAKFSLRKKIVQELAGVRRHMLSIQMTTPLLSNKKSQPGVTKHAIPQSPRTPAPTTPVRGQSPARGQSPVFQTSPAVATGPSTPRRDGGRDIGHVISHSRNINGAALADSETLVKLIDLFETALAHKTGTTTSGDATAATQSVSMVVNRVGDVRHLLQAVMENKSESFSLLQGVVAAFLLSLLGVAPPAVETGLYEADTTTALATEHSGISPAQRMINLSSPPSTKKSPTKAAHPDVNSLPPETPALEHQSSADYAHAVFLPNSTGRWLYEEKALAGTVAALIGWDGRKGLYTSSVVHIPIEVVQLAVKLLRNGPVVFDAPAEADGSAVRRRLAGKRRNRDMQGTGLTLLGEFVQMVETMTEVHVPANYMLILQNHVSFFLGRVEKEKNVTPSTPGPGQVTTSGVRPRHAYHERVLSFVSERIARRAAEQARRLRVVVHNHRASKSGGLHVDSLMTTRENEHTGNQW